MIMYCLCNVCTAYSFSRTVRAGLPSGCRVVFMQQMWLDSGPGAHNPLAPFKICIQTLVLRKWILENI